jgi:hypothetical protein
MDQASALPDQPARQGDQKGKNPRHYNTGFFLRGRDHTIFSMQFHIKVQILKKSEIEINARLKN